MIFFIIRRIPDLYILKLVRDGWRQVLSTWAMSRIQTWEYHKVALSHRFLQSYTWTSWTPYGLKRGWMIGRGRMRWSSVMRIIWSFLPTGNLKMQWSCWRGSSPILACNRAQRNQDLLGEFMAFSNCCQAFRITPKLISAVIFGELFDKVAFMVISAVK